MTGSVFALSLLLFSVTGLFWLALLVLVIHGAAMSASNIAALAYVKLEATQDRVGRILALYTIIFRVGPAAEAFAFLGLVATLGIGLMLLQKGTYHA